jgi:hypothetical protein
MSPPTLTHLRSSWYKCTLRWDEVGLDLHEVQVLGSLEKETHTWAERASLQFRRCSMTVTMRIGNTGTARTLTVRGVCGETIHNKTVAQERHGRTRVN